MFDFRVVTQWVDATLHQYLPASLVTTTEFVLVGVCLLVAYAVMALGLIYAERKVCAFFQCRLGPNRVGPFGMIQTVTDMIKMLIKEIIEINHVDRFLFNLAPYIVIIASLLAFSCIPFAKGLEIIDFNVGIFFLIAVSSIGIVGILLAGWASNNKFSLIGAMRSGAQMISYELSIGLSILTMVVLTGSMQLSTIVESQADGWFIFKGHLPALIAFIVYLIAGTAETNRSRIGTDSRLPYRIFGHALRFLLRGRIRQYVYCGSRSDYLILGRLDAFTYTGLGKFQHRDGLHPFDLLVSGKKCRYGIYHHVV